MFWHSPEGNFTDNAGDTSPTYEFENYFLRSQTHLPEANELTGMPLLAISITVVTHDLNSVEKVLRCAVIAFLAFSAYQIAKNLCTWCHQMETFSALLVTGEFPSQRPVTWSFDVFFDPCLNKWLSKQLWGWWFEMSSCPLWHHCNDMPWQHSYHGMCKTL